ncbi:2-succinyl-6-hydroxy-2,4-cyclohexadiene-1-carboxylate synthase [Priestia endophytica]|uniref:2-succinyl-6-hydroxy-2, 4-cyclohexadiene-1-carboxylate synthase n=1 Tax=Priestia endophytica TaxID=135735 RepID=UPI00124BDDBD|nr:2-succinyl-6-hydroxy-2,4-cyclohexadiene-1-carboxylate synthase [Priestia endophytica]KAB2490405.1 2-succinyl-6-hydroxy-2,4-cyclohexadiene-1-carboxylate synthase [Priestia endophytica]
MNKIIRGVNYNIEINGEGPPLLLLHGFTGSQATWKHVKEDFTRYKVITVDLIGHGETDKPADPSRYTMEETVADLVQLLYELKIEKAAILGYSMGGRVALSFAILYPHKVTALILESSSPGLKTIEEKKARQMNDEQLASFIHEKGIEAFVEKWENISLFHSQKSLPNDIIEEVRKERLKNVPRGLANSLIGMGTGMQPSWWPLLSTLNLPTLLITGKLDTKFCQIGSEIDEQLTNSFLERVEEVGHAIHVEKPRIFSKIVDGFLQSVHE